MPSLFEVKETRQGSVEPFTRIVSDDAWYADQFRGQPQKYVHALTPEEVADLDAAVAGVERLGIEEVQTVTKEQFPLPVLGLVLEALREEVIHGRGFALISGVPVQRYTRRQSVVAYWGMGLYWGKAVSQNKKGHLVGHIKDIGHDPKDPVTRLYATSAAQPYHNDAADIVSLLCLKQAKEGGNSAWSSSITVHNELLKCYPDLVPVLAGPWFFDRKNEVPAGKKPYMEIPVFNYYKGYLSVNYSDNYYFLSQRHPEVPRLTEHHLEAIKRFNELASSDTLRMDHVLQPGEVQLLSNHTVLHQRSEFVDYEDINEKRHLLRLWLAAPNDRPLPSCYEDILGGSVEVGRRGGIRIEGFNECVPLEAE